MNFKLAWDATKVGYSYMFGNNFKHIWQYTLLPMGITALSFLYESYYATPDSKSYTLFFILVTSISIAPLALRITQCELQKDEDLVSIKNTMLRKKNNSILANFLSEAFQGTILCGFIALCYSFIMYFEIATSGPLLAMLDMPEAKVEFLTSFITILFAVVTGFVALFYYLFRGAPIKFIDMMINGDMTWKASCKVASKNKSALFLAVVIAYLPTFIFMPSYIYKGMSLLAEQPLADIIEGQHTTYHMSMQENALFLFTAYFSLCCIGAFAHIYKVAKEKSVQAPQLTHLG